MLLNMAGESVTRWTPSHDLEERPAEVFDVTWQGGEQRLIATVRYAANLNEDDTSAVIIFEDVFCFKVFDENMDGSLALVSDAAQLPSPYPYGGRWPFLEVSSSEWIAELVASDGVWEASEFRHLVITSRNMHLHVACRRLTEPSYHAGG